MKIAIIGGSIAGMATAVRMQQSGHEVTLWERSSASDRRGGFGMILDSATTGLLQELGLRLDHCAHPIHTYSVHDCVSGFHHHEPMQKCLGIERRHNVCQLKSLLHPGTLRFDAEFERFEVDEKGAATSAVFTDGRKVQADLFVGADGSRSKVRKEHLPGPAIAPVKTVELVGISSFKESPALVKGCFRKVLRTTGGAALGMVPTGDDNVVWYFQWDLRRWPQTLWEPGDRNAWLTRELRSWPGFVREIVHRGGLEGAHLYGTADRDLPDRFHRNNVVLVGDAAHPLLTFTSQGVGSAVEDAILLINLIDQNDKTSARGLDVELETQPKWSMRMLKLRILYWGKLQRQFLGLDANFPSTIPICA